VCLQNRLKSATRWRSGLELANCGADLDEGQRPRSALGRRTARIAEGGHDRDSSAFSVPGIPGAHGFTKTAKDGAGQNIIWADGPFIYHVGVGWGPQVTDKPTQAQLIAAVMTLNSRVPRASRTAAQ
jgi:hypothetical protein